MTPWNISPQASQAIAQSIATARAGNSAPAALGANSLPLFLQQKAQQQRGAALQTPQGAAADQALRQSMQPGVTAAQRSEVDLNGNSPGVVTTSDRLLNAATAAASTQQPQVQPNIDTRNQYVQNGGYISAQNIQKQGPNPQVIQLLRSIYSNQKLF